VTPRGGVVAEVDGGSPAARAGLAPRDVVEQAESVPLTDVLAWSWASTGDRVTVLVRSASGAAREVVMVRRPGERWGLSFEDVVFDGVMTCVNDCAFCFLGNLPSGLRPSLYLRDDDYRLSFLQGNFVTLTNVDDDDVARILEMRLSPLFVSVHAVDADVRARLMCPGADDRGLERLQELLVGGIEVHAQIVLVPGENDGEVLQETLRWLARHEGVRSVGVVPAASTAHAPRVAPPLDAEHARALLDALDPWRERMRVERGLSWAHAADEFWLAAGTPTPAGTDYDAYPQFENGIGLVRSFLDELDELEAAGSFPANGLGPEARGEPIALITGTLFAPVLERAARGLGDRGRDVRVVSAENRVLGGDVSVAGLLTGEDIVRTIRKDGGRGVYIVPEVVFNSDGVTLDDRTLPDIARASEADVRTVRSDARGLVAAVLGTGTDPRVRP
jgi:putative radical SAM enzyme (TIGR03279 family)